MYNTIYGHATTQAAQQDLTGDYHQFMVLIHVLSTFIV